MVIVRIAHSLTPDHKPVYVIQWKDQYAGFGFEEFFSLEDLKEEVEAAGRDLNDMHIEERVYNWWGDIEQYVHNIATNVDHIKYRIPCERCGGKKYTASGYVGAKNVEFICDNCGKKLYVAKKAIDQWIYGV